MFHQKCFCNRSDACVGTSSWWSCQPPVAHTCSFLNHLNSFCGWMYKLNTKFDADSLLYSLSHFECDSHIVYMLTQRCLLPPLTSTVKSYCSRTCIPVHSPWLPGYINFAQTVLVTLPMAEIFLDRPCILIIALFIGVYKKIKLKTPQWLSWKNLVSIWWCTLLDKVHREAVRPSWPSSWAQAIRGSSPSPSPLEGTFCPLFP